MARAHVGAAPSTDVFGPVFKILTGRETVEFDFYRFFMNNVIFLVNSVDFL
jgi:hypothetical protein